MKDEKFKNWKRAEFEKWLEGKKDGAIVRCASSREKAGNFVKAGFAVRSWASRNLAKAVKDEWEVHLWTSKLDFLKERDENFDVDNWITTTLIDRTRPRNNSSDPIDNAIEWVKENTADEVAREMARHWGWLDFHGANLKEVGLLK